MLGAPAIGTILEDFSREEGPTHFSDGQRITIAGVVSSSKTKTTKNNSLMAYVVVEDDTASMELLCFSRVLDTCGAYLKENQAVVVKGKLIRFLTKHTATPASGPMLNAAINAGISEKSNLMKDGIKGTLKLSIISTVAAALNTPVTAI